MSRDSYDELAWTRRRATGREEAAGLGLALVAGLAVGTVTWYLARTLLARDPLPLRPPASEEPGEAP